MEYDHFHREPSGDERLQLNAISLVTSIASIPWAAAHNDAQFVELNRTQIERIRTAIG